MSRPVAIVTAASRGMGAAIARRLHAAGYRLALMSSSQQITGLAAEVQAASMQGSVTQPADLQALVELALEHYGRIDAVVNNTGHPPKGDLLALTDHDWQAGMELVLMNVIRMARLVVPVMQQQGGGSIVNISSFGALEPTLDYPVSSVGRAALAAYVKLFAQRYGPDHIRMNNVLPGFIDSYPVTENNLAAIPLQRAGKVEEIAGTVAFLLSEEGAYINGENIKVDGGMSRAL